MQHARGVSLLLAVNLQDTLGSWLTAVQRENSEPQNLLKRVAYNQTGTEHDSRVGSDGGMLDEDMAPPPVLWGASVPARR